MLKVVHISGSTPTEPKKLTAKQRKAKELEMFMDDLRRDRRKAALRMTESIKSILK